MNQPPLNPDALAEAIDTIGRLNVASVEPAIVGRLAIETYLAVAQPVVNSVESIPAQVQAISWEEEPEHKCWKLAPDETFVGLVVKSDRAWSPADKYTLNIERPEVKP